MEDNDADSTDWRVVFVTPDQLEEAIAAPNYLNHSRSHSYRLGEGYLVTYGLSALMRLARVLDERRKARLASP